MNNIVEALIEIPTGSQNKYEVDKKTGRITLDRVLYTAMAYPAEYGYIDETLALDNDPLDILVLTTNPTFPGCIIESRVVGYLDMIDDGEPDQKLIAVPTSDPRFDQIQSLDDIAPHILKEIEHFFRRYKELQNKSCELFGYKNAEAAVALIKECRERYSQK